MDAKNITLCEIDYRQIELRLFYSLTERKGGISMTGFCLFMGMLPFLAAIVTSLVM